MRKIGARTSGELVLMAQQLGLVTRRSGGRIAADAGAIASSSSDGEAQAVTKTPRVGSTLMAIGDARQPQPQGAVRID